MYKINKFYKILIKYSYIFPLISIITNLSVIKNNKFIKYFRNLIMFIIIICTIISGGLVFWFTDFITPINTTYIMYNDLLEPYIEFIKHTINKIYSYISSIYEDYNYSSSTTLSKNDVESLIKDSTLQIKNEVKVGMKEAIDEALTEMDNTEVNSNSLFKNLALFSSVVFFTYFLFVLPGPSISPEALADYNFVSQSLIEFKITVKDFILYYLSDSNNPGNPGNSGIGGTTVNVVENVSNSPITPNTPTTELNKYYPLERGNSGTSAWSEGSVSTITPNTPKAKLTNVIPTQTFVDGLTVSKMVETTNLLSDTLTNDESKMITDFVNNKIKSITD
jgi:hypothetical protein